MSRPPKRSKPTAPAELPDIERHDEIFFRHASGPRAGKVLCRGQHGCTVEAEGKRHKVRWEDVHGHKTKVRPAARVVEQGEDGVIVESPGGHRRFVRDPMGPEPPPEPQAPPKPLGKAFPVVLLLGSAPLLKSTPVKNRAGLSLQDVTDRRGKQTKRWKRTGGAPVGDDRPGGAPADAGASAGYGTHNLGAGDKVSFEAGGVKGEGEIVNDPGADGALVRDQAGEVHRVLWTEITGHKRPPHGQAPAQPKEAQPEHEDGDSFIADDYARQHNDPNATPESILSHFPDDTAQKIEAVKARLEHIEQTIDRHRSGDAYSTERTKLHRQILFEGREGRDPDDPTKTKFYPGLFAPERIKAATPVEGERPTFTMLGGRGGSGKSWFKGKVYDEHKAIVLDADEIKHMLPEYEGWNAHQVHEESSDLIEDSLKMARTAGLNVVLDATMKSAKGAVDKVQAFKGEGYRIEAHYMHLPRQEAAKRAVGRFLGKTGRYVPPEVVLGNTTNEGVFDQVRPHADAWSFHDNNVPKGQAPKLIARGKTTAKA